MTPKCSSGILRKSLSQAHPIQRAALYGVGDEVGVKEPFPLNKIPSRMAGYDAARDCQLDRLRTRGVCPMDIILFKFFLDMKTQCSCLKQGQTTAI